MVDFTRIKTLLKNEGIKSSYLCERLGVGRNYFVNAEKQGNDIPQDKLEIISYILHTSVMYLRNETDDPREDTSISPIKSEMLKIINNASETELKQIYKIVMAFKEDE